MAELNYYTDLHLHKNQLIEARFQVSATAPTSPVTGQFYFNSTDNKFYGWNGTAWIDLSQVVSGVCQIRGEISNAQTNPAFPSSPSVGDIWMVTTNAGTVGGLTAEVGDQLIYSTSGWFVQQANLQAATTAIAGYIRLATQSEANAGSATGLAISPATLAGYLANYLYARKSTVLVALLAANTPTTVTHGLALAAAEELVCQAYQGGNQINLRISPSTVNAVIVESNQALSNVKIVAQG